MAKPTNRFLRRAYYVGSRLRERKSFTFLGRSFHVAEGVLNPTAFRASLVFGRASLEQAPSKPSRFLELGCGCGLTSVLLAHAGHHVTAVDIDPRAVLNTRSNAERNGVAMRVLVSDWDKALDADEQFDFISMNPPFLTEEPPAFHQALYAGSDLSLLQGGLVAARRRLADGGRLLTLTSDRTGRESFLERTRRAGLLVVLSQQNREWFDTYYTDLLEPA
jgi:release factor glutamine methyltransferase